MSDTTDTDAASPASTGNAGVHFEARVGAYYALSMLTGGEPRGLPGTTVSEVAFQQRVAGHPLDDIVVRAVDRRGYTATLEIQVKRSLSFTASDREFADVASQLAQAAAKAEFAEQRYELAVAIAKTTTRIEKDVQEVLRWARASSDAAQFFNGLNRRNFASDSMRSVVDVFRTNFKAQAAPDGDGYVWRVLRRFNVLVFDFEAPGSNNEHWAVERSSLALPPEDRARGRDLWNSLVLDTETVASAAGSRTRASLSQKLEQEHGFVLDGSLDLKPFLASLTDATRMAAEGLSDTVSGAHLLRSKLVDECFGALAEQRVLQIVGAPGVGKTAILKRALDQFLTEGQAIFLRPGRITPGGWRSMAHQLGTDLASDIVFNELAANGGATVFIDNIDQIESAGERETVADLMTAVSRFPGWRAVVTSNGSSEWRRLLPDVLRASVSTISVPEISDSEASSLAEQNPRLGALLANGHPAKDMARNLFFLGRLAELDDTTGTVSTELDLAELWWRYGAGRGEDTGRFARLAVLRKMALEVWAIPTRVATRTDDLPAGVVAELLKLDAVREALRGAEVAFRHDVLRDWALGYLLHEQPELFEQVSKSDPAPSAVVRGLEFTARLALKEDASGQSWLALLAKTKGENIHGSWRRPLLLALARSEHGAEWLDGFRDVLFLDNGQLLGELLRVLLVVDTVPIGEILAKLAPDNQRPPTTSDFLVPHGSAWFPVVHWLVDRSDELPTAVIPDAASVFFAWLLGVNLVPMDVHGRIVQLVFDWLELVTEAGGARSFRADDELPALNIDNLNDTREQLTLTAYSFAQLNPSAARRYLQRLNDRRADYNEVTDLLKRRGNLARAAPREYSAALLKELIGNDGDDGDNFSHRGPFKTYGFDFRPASPTQGPFLEILDQSPEDGLALVRTIVERATRWQMVGYRRGGVQVPSVTIMLSSNQTRFVGDLSVYLMARTDMPSPVPTSALMALEAWAHQRINAGEDIQGVLKDVLGPDGSSCAFLAVAVDLALSHWATAKDACWFLAASPRLLQFDSERYVRDTTGLYRRERPFQEPKGEVSLADLDAKASRKLRLSDSLFYYAFSAPPETKRTLLEALTIATEAASDEEDEDADPLLSVVAFGKRSMRMLDPANWAETQVARPDASSVTVWHYIPDDKERIEQQERAEASSRQSRRAEIMAWLHLCFDDPGKYFDPERLRQAVVWAKSEPEHQAPAEDFDANMGPRAVVTAAALVARSYWEADRADLLAWAHPILLREVARPRASTLFDTDQIAYSPPAIATVGLLALAGPDIPLTESAPLVMGLAIGASGAMANAMGTAFSSWKGNDDRLVRSIFRVLMLKCIYTAGRDGDDTETQVSSRRLAARIRKAGDKEVSWLASPGATEPAWPRLPSWPLRPGKTFRIGGSGTERRRAAPRENAELYVDEQRLATLFGHLLPLMIGQLPGWIPQLVDHLMRWTIEANSLDDDHRPEGRPYSWNAAFFSHLGILCAALPQNVAVERYVNPIAGLGDDAFHDASASLLRGFDTAVFSNDATKPSDVAYFRRAVADRLKNTRNYRRIGRERGETSESRAGDTLTAMFFQNTPIIGSRIVRFPKDWTGIESVCPTLCELVVGAPGSGFLAALFLEVLEAAPRASFSPHLVAALSAWAAFYGTDTSFWVHQNKGARACRWLQDCLDLGQPLPLDSSQLDVLTQALDVMTQAGVASARRLEDRLAG